MNYPVIDFGRICCEWRKRNNITRRQIATDCDTDYNIIYKFETMNRRSYKLLSWYITHGCDITYEMTRK